MQRLTDRSAAPIRDPDRYEILGEHGRGGLGRVSRAHDKDLGRDIAIKELLTRGHLNELRFVREAMITARLEHPGIVAVHEAGRWPDGTPFYAMKLVSGRPLRALIAERRTVDERIGLLHHVIAVADAIAYAHGRNIIHRDLKPANVIVGDFGETVVIDWGLAKDLSDATEIGGVGGSAAASIDDQLTTAGSVLGTPAYMAPEQERGEAVDQRADVFAIGAMLWELCSLTKVPPTNIRARHRMLRRAGIDHDLVAIIDKAIDPDPRGRYAHAGALAADLKAFKSGARITARDYSLPAMLAHWTRRHRTLAVSAVVFALLVLGSLTALAVLYRASTRHADTAQRRLIQSHVEQGRHALLDNKSDEALVYLAEAYRHGDASADVQFMLARAAQSRLMTHAVLTNPSGRLWSASFSPDDKRIITTDDRGAHVWDAMTHQVLFALPHTAQLYGADYARDGKSIITAGMDGVVKVWSADSGALIRVLSHRLPGLAQPTYALVAMSHLGDVVAVADTANGSIHLWNTATGVFLIELENHMRHANPSIAFTMDDRWLAAKTDDAVVVFDTRTWQPALTISVPDIVMVVADPTSLRLLTLTTSGDASIWQVPTGTRLQHLLEAGEPLGPAAFSPDGALVATSRQSGRIQIWQTATGHLQSKLDSHRGHIRSLEFDRSSRLLASTDADRRVVVSDVTTGVAVSVLEGPRAPVHGAHFDPTGELIIAASWDGTARLWNTRPSYRQWSSPLVGRDCGAMLTPVERRFMAITCSEHSTRIWDAVGGEPLAELPATPSLKDYSPGTVISEQGDLAAVPHGKLVGVYRLPGGQLVRTVAHAATVTSVAFSIDGHTLVSGSSDGAVFITADGQAAIPLPRAADAVEVVGLLADGRAVSADVRGRLRVYDRDTHAVLATLELPGRMRVLRPSPDGRHLLLIRNNHWAGPALLLDLEHYQFVASVGDDKMLLFSAKFERHGQEILTASNDGVARRWNATTGQLLKSYVGDPEYLVDATTSPDGRLVVTAGGDGFLRFWGASSGELLWVLRAHADIIGSVHFEGTDLVSRGFAGDVARWRLPAVPSSAALDSLLRCLPLRYDDETGTLVEQPPCGPQNWWLDDHAAPDAGSRESGAIVRP